MTKRPSLHQPERLENDPPGFDPVFTHGSQFKNGCMACPLKIGRCTHPCRAEDRPEGKSVHYVPTP